MGHPYYDMVDNSTDFEHKILRVIKLICDRIVRVGIEIQADERLKEQTKKRKFLVVKVPAPKEFPTHQDFDVEHHYLLSADETVQCRIRKRGQNGQYNILRNLYVIRLGPKPAWSMDIPPPSKRPFMFLICLQVSLLTITRKEE